MDKNNIIRAILYVVLFIAVFYLIQMLVQYLAIGVYAYLEKPGIEEIINGMQQGKYSSVIAVSSVLSSLITIVLFTKTQWAPVSRTYLKTRPWAVLCWSALLALGTILPMEYIYEQLQIAMPENTRQLFEGIMKEPWGYAAVGIFAPIAEELIFRGAILRVLLDAFGRKGTWLAILLSAALFGAIHLNPAQGIHGFIMGILLGWMYCRTRSIIPGIVLHWVNNTVAYLMFNLMPQMADGKLIDLFHHDTRIMYGGLFFSLCILVPSIFQLALRMRREDK